MAIETGTSSSARAGQPAPILIPWEQVQTVFLDMDGTLLDLHFDNHFWLEHLPRRLAEHKAISVQQAEAWVSGHCANIEGTLDWYCLDYWERYLGMDMVALKHEVADRIAVRAHVDQFLVYLHQLGKRVVLLTNAHQKSVGLKFGYVNLERYFDQVITSHTLGVAKEHEDFWSRLAGIEVFDPAHSLFIDDNLQVLRTAKNHGVKYLLAVREPDSRLPPKDTGEFIAVSCYTQLMDGI